MQFHPRETYTGPACPQSPLPSLSTRCDTLFMELSRYVFMGHNFTFTPKWPLDLWQHFACEGYRHFFGSQQMAVAAMVPSPQKYVRNDVMT